MQLKNPFKFSLFVACTVGFVFSAIILFLSFNWPVQVSYANSVSLVSNTTPPTLSPTESTKSEEQTGRGLPIYLKIPKIDVEATIENVGFTSNGAVGAPENQSDVAWFNYSPRPGENGSAVISGHYGWKSRQASAFDDLYKLRPGDKLYIEDDRGVITTFVARANRRYDPEADASAVFASNDGKAHLNLITCEGDWSEATKSYTSRLVVFTDKE